MKKVNCILLIDDNHADNVYHSIIIRKAGICNHIKVAENGREGIDYIIKCADSNHSNDFPKPELIYLDINMPGMNGFEFLEEYEKLDHDLKSKIVIVMLSTSLNPDDEKTARDNKEVAEFKNKPLTIEMLQDTVERYFQ